MVDSEKQRDFLIDFSSEDDCLIDSPLCDPINPKSSEKGRETKTVRFATDNEEGEKAKEPSDSSEQDEPRKNGKYNLRKSLAWDSAFFTSAGFLEPDELSSMLEGNEKGQVQTLPEIQEDVNKSYDSLTTLDSETLTLESLEAELFEDVRASIQKSNKVPITPSSSAKMELKTTKTKIVSSSKKVELTTQDKMRLKATPKKPNVGVKDSGKTLKQVVIRPLIPQTVQSVARSEATSSLHKPPKVLSSVGLSSTKRASLGGKNVKMEKDSKTVTGRGSTVLKTPALGGARNFVPRPKPSSKPSSCSPASSKTELTSSCSSLESCASVSSNRINNSSLNSIKPKHGSRMFNPSSSGKTIAKQSKIAPKGKTQAGSSKVPTFLRSSTKISSSISPASSISEWSSESSSSISASNPSSNVVRASLGTGFRKGLATDCDTHQVQGEGAEVTGSLADSENKVSAGATRLLHPPLTKPSGLRMPSPKLGFFDGVRSSGRTPNGSMLSHPSVTNGLPKIGAKSTSPHGSSSKANIAKLQPVRTLSAIQSPKVDVKQTSSAVKSRSSLSIQKSPITATEVLSSSRNLKTSPGIYPKLQNKSSPGTVRERYSKAEGIGSAEKVVGQESKDDACIKDIKIVPLDGITERTADIASKSDVQNKIASKEADDNETYIYPCLKTDTVFLHGINKKEENSVEDPIDSVRKELIADSHLSRYHELENCFEDTKIVPLDGVTETTADIDSKSNVQNPIASEETTENKTYSYPCIKTDTVFLNDINKKEENSVEDPIANVHKELIADSHLSHYQELENCFEDIKIVPRDGVTETAADIASKSNVQNPIASKETTENETYSYPCIKSDTVKETTENETYSYPCIKSDTVFLYDTNKKEEAPVEDQIGAVRKEPIADSHLSHCHKEFENSLSNPTPTSPSPMTSDSRIPFSVKDSFYNTDASLDVLSGSAATPVKTMILPFQERTLAENNS